MAGWKRDVSVRPNCVNRIHTGEPDAQLIKSPDSLKSSCWPSASAACGTERAGISWFGASITASAWPSTPTIGPCWDRWAGRSAIDWIAMPPVAWGLNMVYVGVGWLFFFFPVTEAVGMIWLLFTSAA